VTHGMRWVGLNSARGQFIGRLGVVSIPAVGVGLDLDERVVRRHVTKLEAAGWLARAPWVWGEGSVVWLTGAGMEGAGLGGIRAVKAPPGATTIAHGVLVGWSAARVEHRGRVWKSARELALDRERWAIRTRCDRGYTKQLPDLAVWLKRSAPPVAVIAESGGRREDRQKLILEGWRDGILSGRYAGVHYHCASASVAHWISRLARKARLTGPTFVAAVQMGAEEIAALSTVDNDSEEPPASEPESPEAAKPGNRQFQVAPVPVTPRPPPIRIEQQVTPPEPRPETPEEAAERERRYREIFGIPDPKPRRRWRR
jgi:hypothetical protein